MIHKVDFPLQKWWFLGIDYFAMFECWKHICATNYKMSQRKIDELDSMHYQLITSRDDDYNMNFQTITSRNKLAREFLYVRWLCDA